MGHVRSRITNHDHVSFLIASTMTIVFLAAPCDGDEDNCAGGYVVSACYETISLLLNRRNEGGGPYELRDRNSEERTLFGSFLGWYEND